MTQFNHLSSFRRWLKRSLTKPIRKARRPYGPSVEALEDRIVQTVTPALDWAMPDRFGVDNGVFVAPGNTPVVRDGRIDMWNASGFSSRNNRARMSRCQFSESPPSR